MPSWTELNVCVLEDPRSLLGVSEDTFQHATLLYLGFLIHFLELLSFCDRKSRVNWPFCKANELKQPNSFFFSYCTSIHLWLVSSEILLKKSKITLDFWLIRKMPAIAIAIACCMPTMAKPIGRMNQKWEVYFGKFVISNWKI